MKVLQAATAIVALTLLVAKFQSRDWVDVYSGGDGVGDSGGVEKRLERTMTALDGP